MADNKDSKAVDLVEQVDSAKEDVDVLRSVRGVAALEVAGRLEPPKKTSKRMMQLYFICGFMFLGSTMNGYDGSLFGNILALERFQQHFGATIVGVKTGIISSMLQIGSVSALPFVGPAADLYGRRVGIAIGCAFIVMGTILQGTAPHLDQYMAGRFFVGFGGTSKSSNHLHLSTCGRVLLQATPVVLSVTDSIAQYV